MPGQKCNLRRKDQVCYVVLTGEIHRALNGTVTGENGATNIINLNTLVLNIVTCRVVRVTIMTGSGLDDGILLVLRLQALS
jgi:hypothetical protein